MNTILLILCLIPLVLYIIKMKNYKFSTKEIVVVAMFSAMSYMLSLIPIVRYINGGGINMFSMLPLLIVSIVFTREAGLTAGFITGIISMMMGGIIIHPAQVILDYILPYMALGLSDIFGKEDKRKVALGCLLAVLLNVLSHFLSGIIFFGQFAPEGMGAALYSFLYNFSGHGVEGILCIVIMSLLPMKNIKKLSKI